MPESAALIDEILIPEATVLTAKGDTAAVDLSGAESRVFLLSLKISEAVEQEYIELSLFGSADGTSWPATPLTTLPQRFYAGEYPTLVDLNAAPETKFVRVHWELARWGRGELTPRMVCGLRMQHVPREVLREAQSFQG